MSAKLLLPYRVVFTNASAHEMSGRMLGPTPSLANWIRHDRRKAESRSLSPISLSVEDHRRKPTKRNESGRKTGGERGIRTLGRVSPTHAFQACSFNHSDISPREWNQQFNSSS